MILRNPSKRRLGESGVTLVELLLVMGLLAIFMTVLASIFTATLDLQNQNQTTSALLQTGRYLDAKLAYDIGRADAITTPNSPGATASSLQLTSGSTTYTYSLSSDALVRSDGSATDAFTGSELQLTSLSFTTLYTPGAKPTVRYSYTLHTTATAPGSVSTQTFTNTVAIR